MNRPNLAFQLAAMALSVISPEHIEIVALLEEAKLETAKLPEFVPVKHKCANHGEHPDLRCKADARIGHIYCKACYLAIGGYDRNP